MVEVELAKSVLLCLQIFLTIIYLFVRVCNLLQTDKCKKNWTPLKLNLSFKILFQTVIFFLFLKNAEVCECGCFTEKQMRKSGF